jgi:hypothetical protein
LTFYIGTGLIAARAIQDPLTGHCRAIQRLKPRRGDPVAANLNRATSNIP